MKQTKKIESPKQRLLTASQRAMAAAKRIENLAPLARQRQRAGVKAPDGTKGKASKQAATEEGVGTRSVELARLVRRRCMPEVVAAVESGLITVSTAAKLAKAYPGTQQRIVKKVEKGRPVLEVLAEIGFQDRRPPKFDDGVFKKLL